MSIVQEFKEFAVKGNVIDMAVGVIVGTAFGKIVSSFVSDVIMPPIGVLLGGVNFPDPGIHHQGSGRNFASCRDGLRRVHARP